MSLKKYHDKSSSLTLATPSGLPSNVKHAVNILKALGVCDDAMFLTLIDDCITADKLHLCRMVQQGAFSDLAGIRPDRIAFSGTDLHIPFDPAPSEILPPCEIVINLASSSVSGLYYDRAREHYMDVAAEPLYAQQILSAVSARADSGTEDSLTALKDMFRRLRDVAYKCYTAQSPLPEGQRLYDVVMDLAVMPDQP